MGAFLLFTSLTAFFLGGGGVGLKEDITELSSMTTK